MFDTDSANHVVSSDSNVQPVTDSATGSQNGESKYASYYKLNGISTEAGTSGENATESDGTGEGVETAGETQQGAGKPPAEKDVQPEGESGYSRRVRVLTAREKQHKAKISALESELNQLKAKKAPGAKLTEDHFATREEYDDHRIEQKLDERMRAERISNLEKELGSEQTGAFKSSWQAKVEAWYPTPEARTEFSRLIRSSQNTLSPDMHDFVQASQVGAPMLDWLLRNPEATATLAGMKPVVLANRMGKLEEALLAHLTSNFKTAGAPQARQSQAPAPVGPVGQRGGGGVEASDDGSKDAVRRYIQKHYKR